MNNQAIIAKIDAITGIAGANTIAQATVLGNTVIVSKQVKVGDVGIYFQPDLQLSEAFAKANDLIRRKNPDGSKAGGFFEENRKVRAQPFMGIKSNGFWCPLSYLYNTTSVDVDLSLGYEFDTINGVVICNKYYTPETIREMARKKRLGIVLNTFAAPGFLKHVDTEHLFKHIKDIPESSVIHITEKLHGTSFRFGNVWVSRNRYNELPWYKKLLAKAGFRFHLSAGYEEVNGTRNTVMEVNDKNFYDSEEFRNKAIEPLKGKLFEGEVVYGEIVGFTTSGKPIMPGVSTKVLKDKGIERTYGSEMRYTYGCEAGECKIYVYRITRTDKNGNFVEYSWPQVKARCEELGVNYVPEIAIPLSVYIWHSHTAEWAGVVFKEQSEGPSLLDKRHIREGFVIRVEPPIGKPYFLKAKSYTFGVLEGYIKESDNYVDMEEVS